MVTFTLSFRRTQMAAAAQKALVESLQITLSDLEEMLGLDPIADLTTVTSLAVVREITCNELPGTTDTIFRERFQTPTARQEAVTRYLLVRSQALAIQSGVTQQENITPP